MKNYTFDRTRNSDGSTHNPTLKAKASGSGKETAKLVNNRAWSFNSLTRGSKLQGLGSAAEFVSRHALGTSHLGRKEKVPDGGRTTKLNLTST
jgi:hypothetical protein